MIQRVSAWCPHHGYYSLTEKEIGQIMNINGPRSCSLSRFIGPAFGSCNEEVIIFINGKKMTNISDLQRLYETPKKIS